MDDARNKDDALSIVDLLDTGLPSDDKLISELKKIAENPANKEARTCRNALDVIYRQAAQITRIRSLLSQSIARELNYVTRNAELAKDVSILTHKLEVITEKFNLCKDANEAIKQKAATIMKEAAALEKQFSKYIKKRKSDDK